MDIIAATKVEANAHLEQLRQERGIDRNQLRNSALITSLDQALNILSDQLYQAATHFILELIQNADDNSYDSGTVPSLHLSLYNKDGQKCFRSDCNEVGFTLKQLDALARVGQSTKTSPVDNSNGYIGEKGIGFKSVFKVANVVHIASGFYEFKFNRNEPIGMILPIPSIFPVADRVAHHTQFLLELKHERDHNDILRELKSIEPDLLLFLRNLDQIRISTHGASKHYRRITTEFDSKYGGETVTISSRGNVVMDKTYIVHGHSAQRLPPDSRRDGVTSSEIIIAFMIKDEVTPLATPQKVFAFLPIDNFGFRFLIHADFILVASRESLEYSSSWNRHLQVEIKRAFVDAIRRFVALPAIGDGRGLRYKWPKYLLRYPGGSWFWRHLHEDMLEALRHSSLLESRNGGPLRKPTDLHHVPEKYRFEDGTLFDLPLVNKSHLSFAYDGVRQELSLIGVRGLDLQGLCDQFRLWIDKVGIAGIKLQSTKWHRQVSSVFCGTSLRGNLRDFPIVPLRDGSWVKASEDHIYFASRDEDEHVPNGVNLSIVDRHASQDPERRSFLEFLGIREYSPGQVCRLILELHNDLFRDVSSRTGEDLVTDAVYLFNHRREGDGAPRIIFAAMRGGEPVRRWKSQVYLIDPAVKPNLIAQYRNAASNPFAVLSDEYETEICKQGPHTAGLFHNWLLRSEHAIFSTVPTLLRNNKLSDEWHFLRRHNVIDLLQAIRLYKQRTSSLSLRILKAAAELQVPCLDGTLKSLGLLALPTPEMEQTCPHLDFARLPDPTSENWSFLSEFGVVTTCSTTARLRELQKLGQLQADEVDRNAVTEIYKALDSSTSFDWEEIQTVFRQSPLVLVFKPRREWLSHTSCVWSAPDPLKRVAKLRDRYRNCKNLFCSILGVGNAVTGHIVDELCYLPEDGDLDVQRFEGLFSLLGRYNAGHSKLSQRQIQRIQDATVFPVMGTHVGEQPRSSLRSMKSGDWYVPDRATLEKAFRGKVAMLSLPVKLVRSLRGLFEDLDYDDMFLSSNIDETTETRGTSIRDMHREGDLKIRLKHISQLAGVSLAIMEDLSMLQVWSVPFISIIRLLDAVEVSDDEKLITIQEDGDAIDIYIREDISMSDQPSVNFELVEYFSSLFEIDAEHTNLVNYLMGASIPGLAEIMEQHDLSFPEDSDNESVDDQSSDGEHNAMTTVHQTPAQRVADVSIEPTTDSSDEGLSTDLEGRFANLEISSEADDDDAASVAHPSSPHYQPLQELIPSHEARTERIVQRASCFQLSESIVERAPIHSPQSDGASHRSLPTRTGRNHSGDGGPSSPGHPALGVSFHENVTARHTPVLSRRHLRSSEVPSSPSQVPQRSQDGGEPVRDVRRREIGFFGELFVYQVIQSHIDNWSYENWTSRLRVEAGHPRFTGREGDFSDFTYLDRFGHMKEVLQEAGMDINAEWSRTTTFHFEVKATLGCCSEPLFVSQNQFDKMRYFDSDVDNAYVLLRVFDLKEGKSPNIKFFRDPWSLYVNGILDFKSDEGYKVYGPA